jgi:glycosyltransferase involved in cell wall biosynthesis
MRLLWVSGIDGFCHRYEVLHRAEQARLFGARSTIRHFEDPRLERDVERCDVLLLYRTPATSFVELVIAHARRRRVAVLGTVDDLIFLPEEPSAGAPAGVAEVDRERWLDGLRRYRRVLDLCDGFVAPTEPLLRIARSLGWNAWLHRDALSAGELALGDAALCRAAAGDRPRRARVLVGYFSGTPTHDRDFAQAAPALLDAMAGDTRIELVLVGPLVLDRRFGALARRIRRVPRVPWPELPGLIADVDVNLAPLELGSAFAEAKGEVKYLEASAVGVPTIASPTPAFAHAIRHGENGLLASSPEEWREALGALVASEELRRTLGEAARRDVELRFSPPARSRELQHILSEACTGPRRGAATSATAVDGAAPRARVALEPDAPLDLALAPSGEVTPPLAAGVCLTQTFRARCDGVFRLDLSTVTYGQRLTRQLRARVLGEDGRLVMERRRGTALAPDHAWWSFSWPPGRIRRGETCTLELTVDASGPGDALSFALAHPRSRDEAPPEVGDAALEGARLGAPLALRTFATWGGFLASASRG